MKKRRKQKVKDTGATVMGVASYRPKQWDRLLEIVINLFLDSDNHFFYWQKAKL